MLRFYSGRCNALIIQYINEEASSQEEYESLLSRCLLIERDGFNEEHFIRVNEQLKKYGFVNPMINAKLEIAFFSWILNEGKSDKPYWDKNDSYYDMFNFFTKTGFFDISKANKYAEYSAGSGWSNPYMLHDIQYGKIAIEEFTQIPVFNTWVRISEIKDGKYCNRTPEDILQDIEEIYRQLEFDQESDYTEVEKAYLALPTTLGEVALPIATDCAESIETIASSRKMSDIALLTNQIKKLRTNRGNVENEVEEGGKIEHE